MPSTSHIRLIKAGAGTGKTYDIAHRVLDHVLEGGCVSEIFVTSFTRKAASELRERILEVLIEYRCYAEAMKLDDAWIGTVHSLGKRMIDLFSFEAGYAPDQDVIPEEEEDLVFGQVMATRLSNDDFRKFSELSDKLGIIDWQKDLLNIVKKARENNIDLAGHRDMADLSGQRQSEIISRIFSDRKFRDEEYIRNELREIKDSFLQIGKKMKNKDISIELITELLPLPELNPEMLGELARKLKDLKSTDREINERFKEAKESVDLINSWLALKSLPDNLEELFTDYFELVFSSAYKVHHAYIDFKKERGLLDYSDQENEFLRLLKRDHVLSYIEDKFRLMLVDEFQDTNPMQLDIFMKLAARIDRVYFVGDLKQSIYAFRNVDPVLIDRVSQHLETEDTLRTSRRSRHSLVEFSNQLFRDAFNAPDDEVKLNPWSKLEDLEDQPVAIRSWDPGEARKENRRKNIASKLKQLIESRELTIREKATGRPGIAGFGNTAILCWSNDEVASWATAFEKLGVEVSAERKLLNRQAEFVFIMASIGYLADSYDSLAISEVLILSDPDYNNDPAAIIDSKLLFNEKREGRWMSGRPVIEKLDQLRTHTDAMSIREIIEQIIIRLDVYGLIARWGDLAVRKANLQKILNLAETYQAYTETWTRTMSLRGFLVWIKSKKDLLQQASASPGAINIMTYHRAKGLEWPVVMLDGLDVLRKEFWWGRFTEDGDTDLNLLDPLRNRQIYMIHNPFGSRMNEDWSRRYIQPPEPILQIIRGSEHATRKRSVEDAEQLRLLYVGITRARDYLIVPASTGISENSWWHRSLGPVAADFFRQKADFHLGEAAVAYSEVIDSVVPDEKEPIMQKYIIPVERSGETKYKPLHVSPSSLEDKENKGKYRDLFTIKYRLSPERMSGSIGQDKDLGDAFHAIMAVWKADAEKSAREEQISEIISAFGLEKELDALKVDNRIEEFYGLIGQLYPGARQFRELPLRMVLDGQIYSGTVDLLLETSGGYILIDYKSYQGGNIEEWSGQYYEQLKAYEAMINASGRKKVLEKLIFYPVSGAIVEILTTSHA